jgi:serine/threonine protein phosphatase PrpC
MSSSSAVSPRSPIARVPRPSSSRGDSRGYLLHGRTLRQLTEDHTLAAALMQAGLLTAEEAKTSDARGVIARAIGSGGR